MARYLVLSVLVAVGTAGYFLLVRDFPGALAALSGGSVGALVFAASMSLTRLYRQLSTPIMMVEHEEDAEHDDDSRLG